MKKAAMMLSVFCIIIFTSACGAPVEYNRISYTDFFSGIKCDIPLETLYSSLPFNHLSSDISFEELRLRLEECSIETNSFTVENLTENALLLTFYENEKKALFLLRSYESKYETEHPYHYAISDFSAWLHNSDKTKDAIGIAQMDGIPLPHHYLRDDILVQTFSAVEPVPVIGTTDDFEAFYKTFQQAYPDHPIEVERFENQLLLRNIPVRYNHTGTSSKGITHYETKQIDLVTITFSVNSENQPVITLLCETD